MCSFIDLNDKTLKGKKSSVDFSLCDDDNNAKIICKVCSDRIPRNGARS